MFVEHDGLSLSNPISKVGGRAALAYPLTSWMNGYLQGEAGAVKLPTGWAPELTATAGVEIPLF